MKEFITMAASRRLLLSSSSSSLFRLHQSTSPLLLSSSLSKTLIRTISYSPFLSLSKTTTHLSPSLITPFSNPNSNFFINRFNTISFVVADIDSAIQQTDRPVCTHPWPEWINFLGKLKNLGFLQIAEIGNDDDDDDESEDDGGGVRKYTKKELNSWRNACLDFARDRFDIFKSLSTEHIQAIVECGCPSLERKPVNSSKRLRATLGIDEGDVCSACKLREDCDRAYGVLKDNEADARTVDIMRMLLIYALDPLVLYGGEKPDGREHIEVSARMLLSELSDLSDTTRDPSLPKPVVIQKKEKTVIQKKEKTMGRKGPPNVEMKRGDWTCTTCNFMNFARNLHCMECNAEGPKGVPSVEMKKGDWNCPTCNYMNFARNLKCLECKTEAPQRLKVEEIEMKKGDWNCSQCQFMNFARNTQCMRCKNARPKRELLPGEWECPSCDFLNYRRNTVCLKCNCDRPRDKVAEYEEQIWTKPQTQRQYR